MSKGRPPCLKVVQHPCPFQPKEVPQQCPLTGVIQSAGLSDHGDGSIPHGNHLQGAAWASQLSIYDVLTPSSPCSAASPHDQSALSTAPIVPHATDSLRMPDVISPQPPLPTSTSHHHLCEPAGLEHGGHQQHVRPCVDQVAQRLIVRKPQARTIGVLPRQVSGQRVELGLQYAEVVWLGCWRLCGWWHGTRGSEAPAC